MSSENKKTILLVEDEAIIAIVEKKSLENLGYNVIIANSGEKGIALVRGKKNIDLILMDINLGDGLDGTEAAVIILKERSIPVVFLSSHTEPDIVEKTEKITSYGYVVKNSGITVLDASIKMAFKLFNVNNQKSESEQRYFTLFNSMTEGFALHEIVFDQNGKPYDYRFINVNPAFEQLTGLKRENIIGKGQKEILPEEDPFWLETYSRVAVTGEAVHLEHYSPVLQKYYGVFSYCPAPGQFAVIFSDITERKKVEEVLLESEERFRSIIENSAAGYFFIDRNGNYKNVNAAWLRMHKYDSPEEILGRHFSVTQVDVDQAEADENVKRLMAGAVIDQGEFTRLCKDGSVAWHIFSTNPVSHGGEVIGLEGFLIDTTKSRKADEEIKAKNDELKALNEELTAANEEMEAANEELIATNENLIITDEKLSHTMEVLSESEERFRKIFEDGQFGLVIVNREFRFENVNPAFCKFTGYSPSELLKMTFKDITHPDHTNEDVANVLKLGSGEIPFYQTEKKYIRKNGDIFWGNLHVSAIRGKDGKLLYFLSAIIDITERRVAEEALNESNKYLENLFNYANAPIIVWDSHFNIIRFNHAFELITGKSADEVFGNSIGILFPPEQVESAMKLIHKTAAGDRLETVEINIQHVDGSVRTVIWNSATLFTEDGKTPFATIAQGQDITVRKQAEAALQQSERKFRAVFEQAAIGIALIETKTGKFVLANQRYAEIIGYSIDEITGTTFQSISYPEDLAADLYNMNRLISGEIRTFVMEKRYYHKDGSLIWVNLTVSPTWQAGDPPDFHIAIVEDITARKKVGEALRQSEQQFKNLVWNMQVGVLLQGPKAEIFLSNPAALELLGLSEDQLLGKTSFDPDWNVIHEDGSPFPGHTHPVPQAIATLQAVHKVIMGVYHPAKNSRVWLLVDAEPQFNDDKTLRQVICTFIDISERKLAEEKVKSLLEEKEIILREVHHRIKNYMNTLNGLLMLQAETLKDTAAISALEDTGARVRCMMILYDKLYQSVDFKNVTSKKYLPSLIDEIISNFPNGKNVSILKQIDDFSLESKKMQSLGIIINELLTNVMKHAFSGRTGGILKISAKMKDKHIILEIQDNGKGIPETVDFKNSTGFGMQLVGMLTEQIGGSIRIERGEGTKFILELDS